MKTSLLLILLLFFSSCDNTVIDLSTDTNDTQTSSLEDSQDSSENEDVVQDSNQDTTNEDGITDSNQDNKPDTPKDTTPSDEELVTIAFNKLNVVQTLLSNIDQFNINSNLYLTNIIDNVNVSWSSDNKTIISNSGVVTMVLYGLGNANISLTATLKHGTFSKTKIFQYTVLEDEPTDYQRVDEVLNLITIKNTLLNNTDNLSITSDLNLSKNIKDVNITWSSSDFTHINSDGKVSRNVYGDGDVAITLTATLSYNLATTTKSFTYKVLEADITDTQIVKNALQKLTFGSILLDNIDKNNVTKDLNLSKSIDKLNITWTSSDTNSIDTYGSVIQKDYNLTDTSVTLNASISYNSYSETKSFTFIVKKKTSLSRVQEILDIIDFDTIKNENNLSTHIVSDLNLSTVYGGSTLTWTSSNPQYISNDGTIIRPSLDVGTKEVTLNLSVTIDTNTLQKDIKVKVMPQRVQALLIIRVEFKNVGYVSDDATWHTKFFSYDSGYLNNYYSEISNDTFKFVEANESYGDVNDGIIDVKINYNHPDTRGNLNGTALLNLVGDAMGTANPYIDYSIYDKNGDNYINYKELQIVFLVAGQEASVDPSQVNSIWAHAYSLQFGLTYDGVNLVRYQEDGRYAMFGERHGDHDATIGIIAHELGHSAFLLPDLYDTTSTTSGIGSFGLMSGGSWNYTGYDKDIGSSPAHMCAYSKVKSKFIKPELLSNSITNYQLYGNTSKNYNIVKVDINSSEYYLLENIDTNSYNKGLWNLEAKTWAGGMAIWHINTLKETGDNTENSDKNNRLVDLVEARDNVIDSGNSYSNYGKRTNLYYNPNKTNFLDITNISNASDTMSFDFK